jgi:uncharacterized protein (TIGR00661 family)
MKVLVCPLNWGLGHATRCVPLIRQYLCEGHEVVLAADGYPLAFLKQEFPDICTLNFPSYRIAYSAGNSQVWAMLRSVPYIFFGIVAEHCRLQKILAREHFDVVISDNRFGLWTKRARSIYITHQLMVKMPSGLRVLENPVRLLHRFFISRYDECFVPDFEECPNLSGDLSHRYPLLPNTRFIGPLSRFGSFQDIAPDKRYRVVAVVSGPEPQRSLFERNLIEQYKDKDYSTLIICGKPEAENPESQIGNVTLKSHLNDSQLAAVLVGADKIICRSGYSGIMDLWTLKCIDKTDFVPTPGQTEQEYLAAHISATYRNL